MAEVWRARELCPTGAFTIQRQHTEVVKEASFDVKEVEVVKNQRMGVLWLDSDGPTVDETWHRIIERTFYSSQFQTVFVA